MRVDTVSVGLRAWFHVRDSENYLQSAMSGTVVVSLLKERQ